MTFRINSVGRVQVHANWTLTPERTRAWTDLNLWFLVSGSGTVRTPEHEYELRPGSCLLMRGGEDYAFRRADDSMFVHYYVHFDCLDDNDQPIRPADADVPGRYRQIDEPLLLELLLERLSSLRRRQERWRRGEGQTWLSAAIQEIRRIDDQDKTPQESQASSDDVRWMETLCRRIENRPHKRWIVDELAAQFGSSRSHFYRCFHQYAGQSPQSFVIEARMRMARILLHDSGNTIAWIAEHLGYRDVYFFSRQFKDRHGCSPSQFRQHHGSAGCVRRLKEAL